MNTIKWKYVVVGVIAYVLGWFIWNLIIGFIQAAMSSSKAGAYELVFQIFNFIVALLPGYLAGMLAKERPVMHGIVVGIAISILVLMFYKFVGVFEQSTLSSILFIPIYILFLSTLGGFVANWHLKRGLAK